MCNKLTSSGIACATDMQLLPPFLCYLSDKLKPIRATKDLKIGKQTNYREIPQWKLTPTKLTKKCGVCSARNVEISFAGSSEMASHQGQLPRVVSTQASNQ